MTRPGDILRSLLFYLAFYGGTIVFVLLAMASLGLSRARFVAIVHGWSRFHRACVERVLRIRVVVEGQLPTSGALLAFKHESFFEAIDLPNLLSLPGIFAKAELIRIPLWGKAASVYGVVSVERGQGAKALRAMLAGAKALVRQGRVLVIFPEGTRVPHGESAPLGSGFAGLYKLLGLPVIPVAVDSGPLYHRAWKRPGTITIAAGEPIPPGLPREEIETRVLAAINTLNPGAVSPRPTGSS